MALDRKTPTPANWPSPKIYTKLFAEEVNDEIEALWARSVEELQSVAGSNTITASLTPTLLAYKKALYVLTPFAANTGTVTLNINSLGARNVVNQDGSSLVSGSLTTSQVYLLWYDGTQFRKLASMSAGGSSSSLPRSHIQGMIAVPDPVDLVNDLAISPGECKDSQDLLDMVSLTTVTKQADAAWAQGNNAGGMFMSANLSGTITFTTNTIVTGTGTSFNTDFQVGDVITSVGGQSRSIATITSATSMTVANAWSSAESGVTYRRGGKARDTTYRVFCIRKDSDGAIDFGFGVRPVPTDLPAGWSSYRRVGLFFTDASINNRNFWNLSDVFHFTAPWNCITGSPGVSTGGTTVTSQLNFPTRFFVKPVISVTPAYITALEDDNLDTGGSRANDGIHLWLKVNSLGQFRVRPSVNGNITNLIASQWFDDRSVA